MSINPYISSHQHLNIDRSVQDRRESSEFSRSHHSHSLSWRTSWEKTSERARQITAVLFTSPENAQHWESAGEFIQKTKIALLVPGIEKIHLDVDRSHEAIIHAYYCFFQAAACEPREQSYFERLGILHWIYGIVSVGGHYFIAESRIQKAHSAAQAVFCFLEALSLKPRNYWMWIQTAQILQHYSLSLYCDFPAFVPLTRPCESQDQYCLVQARFVDAVNAVEADQNNQAAWGRLQQLFNIYCSRSASEMGA